MGKYAIWQLEEMKKTDPVKYAYYTNEDRYKFYGIDLESDDWEAPLYHKAGPQGDRDKFTYFYDIINSEGGVTLRTLDKRLIRISANGSSEELAQNPGERPEFNHPNPGPAPKPLNGWFKFWHFATFGLYGAQRYKEYNTQLQAHERQVQEYEDALEEFNTVTLPQFTERMLLINEHNANLESIGKDPAACDAIVAEHKRAYDAQEEERNRESKTTSKRQDAVSTVISREHGQARLEYLMGTRRDPELAAKVAKEAVEDHILDERVFNPTAEERANPKTAPTILMDIKLPECKDFSDHEIAVLGVAVFSTEKILTGTPEHPIPGGEHVEIAEDKRARADLDNMGMWYNRSEALFTRKRREITHSIAWVNNARAELADLLEKYNNGEKGPLAEAFLEGMRRCSQHVIYNDSVLDENTLADYAVLSGQMLDIVEKNDALREQMKEKGLTDEDMRNAAICKNIGTVWERGVDAMAELAKNPDISAEKKAAAAVDIIGLRITQSLIHANAVEIAGSEEFANATAGFVNDMAVAKAKISTFDPDERQTNPECIKLKGDIDLASAKLSCMQSGSLHGYLGMKTNFSKNVDGMLGDKNRPDELRTVITDKCDIAGLSTLSCDDLLYELLPDNAQKHVDKVFAADAPKKAPQQPQAEAVKQNAGPVV